MECFSPWWGSRIAFATRERSWRSPFSLLQSFRSWSGHFWLVKDRKLAPGIGENRRPDFQELLSNVRLAVWVRTGAAEAARPSLSDRVAAALARPSGVNRFGGLSLGESTHLIDELRALGRADHGEGRLLVGDVEGDLALPVWPDHVGAAGTRWGQYRLVPATVSTEPDERAWSIVRRPEKR
jgi:CRISPR-associated protein Cas5t